MSKFDAYSGDIVRVDRVSVFPGDAPVATKFNERFADIALCADGHVLFKGVGQLRDEWVGALEDVGKPQPISQLFLYSVVAGWAKSPSRIRETCMSLNLGGKRRIVYFTGIVPSDSLFLKIGTHIPHHVGLAVATGNLFAKLRGAGERSRAAANVWRSVLAGTVNPGSLRDP
jgi:hypothetical protein